MDKGSTLLVEATESMVPLGVASFAFGSRGKRRDREKGDEEALLVCRMGVTGGACDK